MKFDGTSSRRFLRFLSLTALWAEGGGGGFAADFKEKGRGSAAGCVEGLHRFAQGGGDSPHGLWGVVAPFGAQRTHFALCELDL